MRRLQEEGFWEMFNVIWILGFIFTEYKFWTYFLDSKIDRYESGENLPITGGEFIIMSIAAIFLWPLFVVGLSFKFVAEALEFARLYLNKGKNKP